MSGRRPGRAPRLLRPLSVVAFAAFLLTASGIAAAQPGATAAPGSQDRWWFAVNAGFARMTMDRGLPGGGTRNGWSLDFSGGAIVSQYLRLGFELGGIGLEAGNLWDSSRGESFSDVFAVAEYYFRPDRPWFAYAGAGRSRYVNNDAELLDMEGSGWGTKLGIGYALPVGARWHVSPRLTYVSGRVSPRREEHADFRYSAVTLSVGVGFP